MLFADSTELGLGKGVHHKNIYVAAVICEVHSGLLPVAKSQLQVPNPRRLLEFRFVEVEIMIAI